MADKITLQAPHKHNFISESQKLFYACSVHMHRTSGSVDERHRLVYRAYKLYVVYLQRMPTRMVHNGDQNLLFKEKESI